MDALITALSLLVLTFATLAQRGSVGKGTGYGIAGALAAVTLVLAWVRFKKRKADGE